MRKTILVGHRTIQWLVPAVILLFSSLSSSFFIPQQAPSWAQVERLAAEQKLAEAAGIAEKLRIAAQQSGNREEWTRALIKEVQLRTGLNGYETAVRFLKDQPWPDGLLNRIALNLFYAHSLVTYYQQYSWEINRREKVASQSTVDLKAWTRDQIYTEAQKAYEDVWKQRLEFGSATSARLGDFLLRNNYPEGIRSTLRDTVSYLYVDLLSDTSCWTPEQSNEIYRLDLKALLADTQKEVTLADPAVHPLIKLCFVLGDLESWHTQSRRSEAALEARLQRLQHLHTSFTADGDRDAVSTALDQLLAGYRNVPWWAEGKAVQAGFARKDDRPGKLVRARAAAAEGWKAYPNSVGGKECFSILKQIEAPAVSMSSMSVDGIQKRSIEVTHANIPALYFRAFAIDLEKRLTMLPLSTLLDLKERESILRSQPSVAEWSVNLPATPDYESHHTSVIPPLKTPGCYLIASSATKDFSKRAGNSISAVMLVVSDLVLLSHQSGSELNVQILSGEGGAPLPGVAVDLYRNVWQRPTPRTAQAVSDRDGFVHFPFSGEAENRDYFLFARQGPNLAFNPGYFYTFPRSKPADKGSSLIYTDRSIYKPNQKILWKVLAYGGNAERSQFTTLSSTPVEVSLMDPNGQKVDIRTYVTNDFGSAAGEFIIPTGRLLGNWTIRTSLSGQASVRVEEYKRPTFEVAIRDPESTPRLNHAFTLTGEVKYYFGLPVSSGSVNWSVTREPVNPYWPDWYGGRASPDTKPQVVAGGTAALGADGISQYSFTPQADERAAGDSQQVSYRYHVTADATDEGGETRTASRTFSIGFVTLSAGISFDTQFLSADKPGTLRLYRGDLNGVPRPGKGVWRLVSLKQPAAASLPADVPLMIRPGAENEFRTAGDLLRPRWATHYSFESLMHRWTDDAEQARGIVTHDDKGEAELELPGLPAGAYRIHYETLDDFGATVRSSREIIVASQQSQLALPAILLAESDEAAVGSKARILACSGLKDQPLIFEVWRGGQLAERRILVSGRDAPLIEIPIGEADRGGLTVKLTALRDHQLMRMDTQVRVPFDNKKLRVELSTFRDKLRPGAKETWRVTVKGPAGTNVEAGAAEILAYMYDRSLDIFAHHSPPDPLWIYDRRDGTPATQSNVGEAEQVVLVNELFRPPNYPYLRSDSLKFYDDYGIGGPGRAFGKGFGGGVTVTASASPGPPRGSLQNATDSIQNITIDGNPNPEPPAQIRSDFAETAFWRPQLLTGPDGSAAIEFVVPDSVTSWNVWVHAVTRDLQGGALHKEAQSVKEIMVRPYLPRFLREGDKAELKIVVNNASGRELKGNLTLDILDPETDQSLLSAFGLARDAALLPFSVAAGKGTSLAFPITAPAKVGLVAFKVTAAADALSDGELRPLPLLPGRMHLSESRFVTLKNKDLREMSFDHLKNPNDPTLINEQMVVTVDAQLFYSVLSALPYLINYPYECTEQTLNRFASTGILSSLYKNYPAIARMAEEFGKRQTPIESWDAADPNRKMALEETPWLSEAGGGSDAGFGMVNVLDPRITRAEQEASLVKLRKAQTADGGFPWWPGGPPSSYMTLYIMYGFAKAAEFGVDVPKDMVQRGWSFLARQFRSEYSANMMKEDCCWEFLTFLNYAASCYPDPSWTGNALTGKERQDILDHSFRHWKEHSPYLKCQLALTLKRMGRAGDAALVFASVMDSAQTTQDQGTFWAPEDRSWLWYNDTIETHAFALRTLMELQPDDSRREGLVQWLFLNKKLNHWKSTRATAEVVYALVHYLQKEGQLAVREDTSVRVGGQTIQYVFEPDQYTGKKNQTVVPGDRLNSSYATVTVAKEAPGFAFASATWQFSTEKLPEQGSGDFLSVSRTIFKREKNGAETILRPLAEGAQLQVGDEVEIQLSVQAKHPCEYIHLRDPRAAGLEPENAVSRYRYDLGVVRYEEVRDSGTNFFFEQLPQGEYTFKYRLRANMAGTFKIAPATLQSMYAPEFTAYSAGALLTVK